MKIFLRFLISSLCLCAFVPCAFIAISALKAEEATEQTPPNPPANPPASPTAAPEPSPVPQPPQPTKPVLPDISMEAYGTANPQCVEWTDSCQTCARDAQNQTACSTPGIACLPGDISCKSERK